MLEVNMLEPKWLPTTRWYDPWMTLGTAVNSWMTPGTAVNSWMVRKFELSVPPSNGSLRDSLRPHRAFETSILGHLGPFKALLGYKALDKGV